MLKETGHSLKGLASWYCRAGVSSCYRRHPDNAGFDAYAAAGPQLRIAMGGTAAIGGPEPWRNRIVSVNGIKVKLVDWCQCYWKRSNEKVIDLYYDVFRRSGGRVVITW